MRFIDLQAQYQKIDKKVQENIQRVLAHGQYIMGPECAELEAQLSEYLGVKHSILVASGTAALQIALMAVGVGPGDEVITSPFSFSGTVEAILLIGARPVFVDIDPISYNLDPSLLSQAITAKTKAIMPVSLYGQCAEFNKINEIAAAHDLPVIEDAAQSFGARYYDKASCALSTIGCTSFFPSKPLGCYGDGGACFTNDDQLALHMRQIANHGQAYRYHHVSLGMNGRFDTLQAAILLAKLPLLNDELQARQQVAAWYQSVLDPYWLAPKVPAHQISAFAQYTIQVEEREALMQYLQEQGIPSTVHYPTLLNEQPLMDECYKKQQFPIAKKMAARVLSLPFHPYLSHADVQRVATVLNARIPLAV